MVRGVELPAMHAGGNRDMNQCCMLWQAQHDFLMPSCTGS
jgi:hypothetical protein